MDRIPPNSLEAEAAVLASVLLQKESLDVLLPILQPKHFYSQANGWIYETFVDLTSKNKPIDILTVKAALNEKGRLSSVGGSEYLAGLLDCVPSVSRTHLEEYAVMIRQKARLRAIIFECQRVEAEGYSVTGDPKEFIDQAEQAIFAISAESESKGPQRINDILKTRFTEIQQRAKSGQKPNLIRCGLSDVDRAMMGLRPGDLAYLAARPGVGKTSFGINNFSIHTASQGTGVAVFSLEMSREQLVDRMMCSQAMVNSRELEAHDGAGLSNDDWRRMGQAAAAIHKLPIFIEDQSAISIMEIRAKCRRIATDCAALKKPLGLVIVDYIQLMGTDPRLKSREEKVSENSRQLKALAKDLGVAVLALAQLNRAVETRGKSAKPQMSDLRESGSLEQDADMILFLNPSEDEGIVEVIVAKGRHFGTGSAHVAFRKQFTRFDSLEPGFSPRGEADY